MNYESRVASSCANDLVQDEHQVRVPHKSARIFTMATSAHSLVVVLFPCHGVLAVIISRLSVLRCCCAGGGDPCVCTGRA